MGGVGSGRRPKRAIAELAATGALSARYAGVIAAAIDEGRELGETGVGKGGGASYRRAAALAMRVSGFTSEEIAAQLGTTKAAVNLMLFRMRREGELDETGPEVDHDIVPQAMAQVRKWVGEGDKESVFAVLKGRGVFKTHTAQPVGGAGAVVTNLVVSFQTPEGGKPVLVGQVVGVPREGEVE